MVDVVAQPVTPGVRKSGYVEWSAVLAGAAVAAALSFVLLTAGTAIGLSLVSPYPSQSFGKLAGSLAAFWVLFVPIVSLLAGGYIAGRMRSAWESAGADEVEFRDGVHGLLVWSVSIFFGGLLAFVTAVTAAQVGGDAMRFAGNDRGSVLAPAVDTLMRTTVAQVDPSPRSTVTPPSSSSDRSSTAAGSATPPGGSMAPAVATRLDSTRVLSEAVANGKLSPDDRQYLAQIVTQRTGLPPAEAEKRVDLAYAQALDAVDKARKATVLAGLATATALLLGLVAAWYAAQQGGRHRDQNIPAKFTFLRPRSLRTTTTIRPESRGPGVNPD